jgi:putative ABC transport system permease protein
MKRQSIEDRAHGLKGFLLAAGVLCFSGALVSAWASRFSILWGFVAAFGMTLAFALFTPAILSLFTHHAGIHLRKTFGLLEAFLAARTIRASLSRTSMAVAALAVALSMTIGVDTMIHSFRQSVADWLEGTLEGDLYISPATAKWDHSLPAGLIRDLKSDPSVEAVERFSSYDVFVNDKPVKLSVVDGSVLKHHSKFRFLHGGESAWDNLMAGGVFISESLGYHLGLSVGDNVVLATPEGDRTFRVVSVARDYSSDQGAIRMDREVYERIWKDYRVQSVALFLKPGASVEELRQFIVKKYPGLDRTIVSNTRMKEDILAIFDKTFALTATLKGVSLLVALLGVATALMAILLERSGEMVVLGYLGLTRKEMGKMNVYQALVMGFAAFVISILCGLILTYIIIYAINYRSFGWSVDVHVNPWIFAKGFVLTMLACFVSALYPAYKLMREPAGLSVKEE